jgi:hypothetical protein
MPLRYCVPASMSVRVLVCMCVDVGMHVHTSCNYFVHHGLSTVIASYIVAKLTVRHHSKAEPSRASPRSAQPAKTGPAKRRTQLPEPLRPAPAFPRVHPGTEQAFRQPSALQLVAWSTHQRCVRQLRFRGCEAGVAQHRRERLVLGVHYAA